MVESVAKISQLLIYPIKSCRGIQLSQAVLTEYGLAMRDNLAVRDR
jgi:uncharacterized protein YcbX